jgi:uridine kinase
MKGDILILKDHHKQAACDIVPQIIERIRRKNTRYIITVAGESGSGKSEIGRAISDELEFNGIRSVILGQDDYFYLPPKSNDLKRRQNPEWLGPHVEVRLDVMEQNLVNAIRGQTEITKPLVDYNANSIGEEKVDLTDIKVMIAEGTYASLLKNVDTRIFINRTWVDTREDRQKRDRGNEARDPFIESLLETEHKIIAGHKHLADFLITPDFKVVKTE